MIYEEKTSSVGARPELHKLLDELKRVIAWSFYKMDRIARSLKDLMGILERVQQAGANIRSLTEPLDTSVPVGVFMVQVLGAVRNSPDKHPLSLVKNKAPQKALLRFWKTVIR